MKISDGMGSYLTIWRDGSYCHINASVGLWPLALSYAWLIGLIVIWKLRRKK